MDQTNGIEKPVRPGYAARTRQLVRSLAIAAATGLVGLAAYASISQIIAIGVVEHFAPLGGPATITMRTLTLEPGEILGWHYHPGVGAYTIVKTGTLTVEDGCGGETVYAEGQAFLEPPLRVHRGKNLTASPVVTAQTFIVPTGDPTSVSPGQVCGVPVEVDECRGGGWMAFDFPRRFVSQGECVEYVITNKLRDLGLH
jgi:quercetin dioxygenase-like cupin family protein